MTDIIDIAYIRSRMVEHDLTDAITHFDGAESAYAAGQWESSNGQIRSYLDAVFEGVARICLSSNKKSGEARKQLQDAGILSGKDAQVVLVVCKLAQERGSHVGKSDPVDSTIRRHLGLAAALIGLSLIPSLVRLEDVFSAIDFKGAPPKDADFVTTCPTCGTEQRLGEGQVARVGSATEYTCKHGCQPILVIGKVEERPWEGRGYRIKDHVLRNPADIFLPVGGSGIKIPASPSALMKRREPKVD
jgi:hypothetical protein